MEFHRRFLRVAVLILGIPAAASTRDATVAADRESRPSREVPAATRGGNRPAPHFEENRGQSDPEVRFLLRGRRYIAFLTPSEAVLVLPRGGRPSSREGRPGDPIETGADVVRMALAGARPGGAVDGAAPQTGTSNYLRGSDRSRWILGAPHFAEAVHRAPWPGVDLRWRGRPGGTLAYEVLLAPGADPRTVEFSFEGASAARVDGSGDLVMSTGSGELRHGRPVAWQEAGGARRRIAAAFELRPGGRIGFRVGPLDPSLPLRIDPEITYGAYVGGGWGEETNGIAVAPNGDVCAAGRTSSPDFPVKNAFFPTKAGAANWADAFVTRYKSDGSTILWSTFLGGTTTDVASDVAVDGEGAVYVAGTTDSSDYPQRQPIMSFHPGEEGFLTKLSPPGTDLVYSTWIGTEDQEGIRGVAVDRAGRAVVVGYSGSSAYPAVKKLQPWRGNIDAFISRMNPEGSAFDFSTSFGGSGKDWPSRVAVAPDDSIVVVGRTESTNLTMLREIDSTLSGTTDGWVTRISGDATPALVFSTYLGGGSFDSAEGVGVDSDGNTWVTGTTQSGDFPLASAIDGALGGASDAFLTGLGPTGTLLVSTYLGGAGDDSGWGVAAVKEELLCVAGKSASSDFPRVNEVQTGNAGLSDAFVTEFSLDGTSIIESTMIGGSASESVFDVAAAPGSLIHVAGATESQNFPVTPSFQTARGSAYDGCVLGLQWLPVAPKDLKPRLTGLTSMIVEWTDASNNEDRIEMQRSENGGPYVDLPDLGAGVQSYSESGLTPATTYTYRVRAANSRGPSPYSEGADLVTPGIPVTAPAAPQSLVATPAGGRRVDLSWVDASDNEDFFIVARKEGTGTFVTKATPILGATSWSDLTPLPDRTYSYLVRAINPIGSSLPTPAATATTAATLLPTLARARILDKDVLGKDSFSATGTIQFLPDSAAAAFDPHGHDLVLRIGDWNSPPVLSIAAADPGWKERKGKFTWKSERGSLSKAVVKVDPAAGTWSVKITRLTLAAPPASPLRLTFGVSSEGGHVEQPFTPGRRPGDFRFP